VSTAYKIQHCVRNDIITNNEFRRATRKAVMAYFKVLIQNFCGGTEENNEKP
jgi:hypothetical protein